MIKKEFIVCEKCDIHQALNKNLGLNFVEIKKILRKGDVKVNNSRVKENILLHGNEKIICFVEEPKIEVVFEDENILIVNKPKKLETISLNGENDLTTLLRKKHAYCNPCHRLDFNTSGLCVFALNESAENEIINAFKQGKVEKKYLAIVGGKPKKNEILDAFLIKNSKISQVKICSSEQSGSTKIKTEYNLVEKFNNDLSLLEVILHTGKTHQIRAHLAFNKMPVLGDKKYGNKDLNEKYKKHTQCLVSYSIKFDFSGSTLLNYISKKEFVLTNNKKEIFDI